MTVYIDEFFIINLIMDFLILITSSKLIKKKTSILRITVAAIAGAVYACIVLVLDIQNGMLQIMITYIVISVFMVLIVYGYESVSVLVEDVLIIFTVTFLLSGIVNTLYYQRIIRGNISLIIIGIISAVLIVVIYKIMEMRRKQNTNFVTVKVVKGEESITVRALVDTGNSLIEPMTKKPVAVISKNMTERFEKRDDGVFMIPYKSVGTEHGMLRGFMADYMVITNDNGKEIVITRQILAEYNGSFTRNDSYQMLLNPQMIEQGERNDCKNENSKQNVF